MIISDRRRFVFVHVPNSAGISIRAALAPFADGGSAVSPDTAACDDGGCRDFVATRYARDIGEFGCAFDRPDAAMRQRSAPA
jgi:hypothetical protein